MSDEQKTGRQVVVPPKRGQHRENDLRGRVTEREQQPAPAPAQEPEKPGSERSLQNRIRNSLAGECLLFRANVGTGWSSSAPPMTVNRPMVASLQPGDVVLRQARPFSSGLPPGFSDTFGAVKVVITPEMVGETIAQFLAGEIKTDVGRVSAKQLAFLQAINNYGGRAGVWRSVDEALRMVRGA